jgi:hypothetical protein
VREQRGEVILNAEMNAAEGLHLTQDIRDMRALDMSCSHLHKANQVFANEQQFLVEQHLVPKPRPIGGLYIREDGCVSAGYAQSFFKFVFHFSFLTQTRPEGGDIGVYVVHPPQTTFTEVFSSSTIISVPCTQLIWNIFQDILNVPFQERHSVHATQVSLKLPTH